LVDSACSVSAAAAGADGLGRFRNGGKWKGDFLAVLSAIAGGWSAVCEFAGLPERGADWD
jgi:hypothetical protein